MTVKDAYEAYRKLSMQQYAIDLSPWNELSYQERAILETVAKSFAAVAVDDALAAMERLCELEADKQFAALDARPDLKVAKRVAP